MMSDLPAPLTPADCDLRDFSYMPLEVARLRDSALVSSVTPECCFAAVLIWCASWHQIPAASIPDDDKWIADKAGYMSLGRINPKWKKVREGALHGFIKCSDGRLYHATVGEKALEAWIQKLIAQHKSGIGNAKRWGAPFDAEQQILKALSDARALLQRLNQQSPVLKKPMPKPSLDIPTGNAAGNPSANPTGIAIDQTGPDQDQTGPVNNKNLSATVIARTWWPSSQTFKDLDMIHHFPRDWVEEQVPAFVAYWFDRNEPRPSFDALFIQHCQHCAKPRVAS